MDELDSSEKIHWSEIAFIISPFGLLGGLIIFLLENAIERYQLFQGILIILMYVVAGGSMFAAVRSNRLTKKQIMASVKPKLWFRIRPANDFWKPPWGPLPIGWKTGVGIYIENVGNGPALNVNMKVEIEGEGGSIKSIPISFGRLKAGIINTIPSTTSPKIEISLIRKPEKFLNRWDKIA